MLLNDEQKSLLDGELSSKLKSLASGFAPGVELDLSWVSMQTGLEAKSVGQAITAYARSKGYHVSAALGVARGDAEGGAAWPVIQLFGEAMVPIAKIDLALNDAIRLLDQAHGEPVSVPWPDLEELLIEEDQAKRVFREFDVRAKELDLRLEFGGAARETRADDSGTRDGVYPIINLHRG